MEKIEVKILEHNCDGMAKFLARLTQRGHLIHSMRDVDALYESSVHTAPSSALLSLPHTTIMRMTYITVAISGLSTKCVSQLRTHAKRLTFVSTSTQYSSYEGKNDNYVIPQSLIGTPAEKKMRDAYEMIHGLYSELITDGYDKDAVGYLLPQGLRKTLVISGPLDAWQYVMRTRLCHRNSEETRYVMRLIYNAIEKECGEVFTTHMLPNCVDGKCLEGKFCCGVKFDKRELIE